MPDYLIHDTDDDGNSDNNKYFQRQTRSYNKTDRLKLKCKITPRVNAFSQSFFPRTYLTWNKLPYDIRIIETPELFKTKLKEHLWLTAEENISDR